VRAHGGDPPAHDAGGPGAHDPRGPGAHATGAAAVSAAIPGTPAGGSRARGRLLVFGATVFWGLSATLARFVFRDREVPPLHVVELRLLFAATMLGLWLALRRPEALRVRREDIGYLVVLGLVGVAALQSSYYVAISTLGVGLAILLQYLAPSLLVVWDSLRGRRPGPLMLASVFAALAGTALLVGQVDDAARRARPLHWAIAFGSAFIFAFYIAFSKRGLARYAPQTVLFHTFLVAGLFWAFVHPPWRIAAAGYDASLWAMFAALGMFSTLVPFSLFYAGLSRLPAAEAGVVATLEPVIAVLASAIVLGEGLRPWQWVGAALVLAAAALASREEPETGPAQAERA
jgi:drug/metabolite transporter (DMT)-like permease